MFRWMIDAIADRVSKRLLARSDSAPGRSTGHRRDVMTVKIHLVQRRGKDRDIEAWVNGDAYCGSQVHSAEFLKIPEPPATETSAQLMGTGQLWLIAIEMPAVLEANSSRPVPTSTNFRIFSHPNTDALQEQVNDFCANHEVVKVKVHFYAHPRHFQVVVTYRIY